MIKTLALIKRLPGSSRDAFREHYETVHVPLALPLLDGLERYVRYHVHANRFGDFAFDVLTAFWYRDRAATDSVFSRLASAEGEAILADELTFMDKPNNHFFEVRPAGGLESKGTAVPGGVKAVLMARAPAGIARPDFLASHGRSLEGILEKAASWSHWETHPALGVPPVCDVVTLVWFPPEAFDPGALRAWSPEAETTWRFRSDERVSRRTDG